MVWFMRPNAQLEMWTTQTHEPYKSATIWKYFNCDKLFASVYIYMIKKIYYVIRLFVIKYFLIKINIPNY